MNLEKYRTLTAVLDCGSLSRAAEELGKTQSAVSHSIDSLERELGFALLNTTTGGSSGGGASLTEEGRAFLDKYDRFCALVNEHAASDFETVFDQTTKT